MAITGKFPGKKGAIEIQSIMQVLLVVTGIAVLALVLSMIFGKLVGSGSVVEELNNATNLTTMAEKNKWELSPPGFNENCISGETGLAENAISHNAIFCKTHIYPLMHI